MASSIHGRRQTRQCLTRLPTDQDDPAGLPLLRGLHQDNGDLGEEYPPGHV